MTSLSKRSAFAAAGVVLVLALGGCVTVPVGPAVMALPGQYKPFDQFRADDLECRQYASAAIGAAGEAVANTAAAQAVGSALLGAAVGAAIGSVSGNAGQGAAIGGGTGLLWGSAAGGSYAGMSSYELQQRYDGAYMQCMYAKGNQVPVRGYADPQGSYAAPPGGSRLPPPPPPQPRPQ
jgi:hypothetical protein